MFYSRQRGSVLMVAIFVITVMAVMAAALIRIDWSGQDTTTREILASRAWYAAHSGNEYMMSKLFPLGSRLADADACHHYTGQLPAARFQCQSLVLTCTKIPYGDGPSPSYKFKLETTARCGNGKFAVSRTQELWAKDVESHD